MCIFLYLSIRFLIFWFILFSNKASYISWTIIYTSSKYLSYCINLFISTRHCIFWSRFPHAYIFVCTPYFIFFFHFYFNIFVYYIFVLRIFYFIIYIVHFIIYILYFILYTSLFLFYILYIIFYIHILHFIFYISHFLGLVHEVSPFRPRGPPGAGVGTTIRLDKFHYLTILFFFYFILLCISIFTPFFSALFYLFISSTFFWSTSTHL